VDLPAVLFLDHCVNERIVVCTDGVGAGELEQVVLERTGLQPANGRTSELYTRLR
jgi:hypothetical protein